MQFLQKAWLKRGPLACVLWPLAMVHRLLVTLRQALYRRDFVASEGFPVPVIVVGNVVAGGAGKTPLVIEVVKHLIKQGLQVGVISRGYGRSGSNCLEVSSKTTADEAGDESVLIVRATGAPVFVAKKRADALRALLGAYPATDVVVCDDGLQHYALKRDIEIVVFDDRGVGNGWLLPAGPLREPWPQRKGLGVDLVLHTGLKPAFEGFTSSRQLADEALDGDTSRVALKQLLGRPLVALAGIANPEAFFTMLRALGLALDKTVAFPDHHNFRQEDLSVYTGRTVLCTEKDAVKLFALDVPADMTLLAVPLVFLPEAAFFTALDSLLAPLLCHLPSEHGHQIT